jgi:FeS assembly SUF system protein
MNHDDDGASVHGATGAREMSATEGATENAMEESTLNQPNTPVADTPADQDEDRTALKTSVITALKTCYDPEIPVDIYELGLIYEVDVREANAVYVKMTLTSPMCPVAEILPLEVEEKVRSVEGVANVDLELVWDPPWDIDMMSEAARLELNF